MATFNVKSTVFEILKYIGYMLAVLLFVAVALHALFSVTRIVFITDCTPSCLTDLTFPLSTNFRPASEVPEYAALSVDIQKRIVFFGWDYIMIVTDTFLRPFYSMYYFFSMAFAREKPIYAFFLVLSAIVGIFEAVKLIIRIVALIDVPDYWFAWAPNNSSTDASFEFMYTFYMSIATVAYIIGMSIVVGVMSGQAAAALKTEKLEGTEPVEEIGSAIGVPLPFPVPVVRPDSDDLR